MIILHLVLIASALLVSWRLAGTVIHAVERVAHHYGKSGFLIAFVVLGLISSATELSVMVSSTITNTPAVAVGNMVGASLVIMTLIIPVVAIANRGITLDHALSIKGLAMTLAVIGLPAILVSDGSLSTIDSSALCMCYIALVLHLNRAKPVTVEAIVNESMKSTTPRLSIDIGKIIIGAVLILMAGHILVRETIAIATMFSLPSSLIALIGLSLGTNVPELSIALSSIQHKKESIAFGDYLGSATGNTLLMGVLGFLNNGARFSQTVFIEAAALLILGLILLFIFASSKRRISPKEGALLLSVYVLFLLMQITTALTW